MSRESRLVNRIVKAIRERWPTAWVFNVHGGPYQMPGVPDLLLCVNGRMVGIEVKDQKPGESEEYARARTTVRQRFQIEKIIEAGGTADVALSVEEALWIVERALSKKD